MMGNSGIRFFQDPVVRLALIGFVLAALPLLIPLLNAEWRAWYGRDVVLLPFLLLALASLARRWHTCSDSRERRFWSLLTLAICGWLAVEIIEHLADYLFLQAGYLHDVVSQAPYILQYVGFIAAVEVQPGVR